MEKDVIIGFADDPGGANGFITLPDVLHSRGVSFDLYSAGAAVRYFQDHGVVSRPRSNFEVEGEVDVDVPDRAVPAAVLVGTSQNPESCGLEYIDYAKSKGIPCFAFVDACVHAEKRFCGVTDDPLYHAPDYLFVTDQNSKDAFSQLGFVADRIFVVGNPRYDFVQQYAFGVEESRKRARCEGVKNILVLVDPLLPTVGEDYDQSGFGASSAAEVRSYLLLQHLAAVQSSLEVSTSWTVKLHPRNSEQEFERYGDVFEIYDGNALGLGLAAGADLVIGTTTSLLVEAALMNVPTIAVLLTPREREWLPDDLPDNLILSDDPQHMAQAIADALQSERSLSFNHERFFQKADHKMTDIMLSVIRSISQ